MSGGKSFESFNSHSSHLKSSPSPNFLPPEDPENDWSNSIGYQTDESARIFFQELETRNKSLLPEYLKNLIFLNGFASAVTFATITEEDFPEMERMCRDEMRDYCPHTPDFFSYFAPCVQHFKIPIGHRRLLTTFIQTLQSDMESLQMRPEKPRKKVPKDFQDQLSLPELPNSSQFPDMVVKLRRAIAILVHRARLEDVVTAEDLDISVRFGENDIFGCVVCPLCDKEIKLSPDQRRKRRNGMPLISPSNFISHIKKPHSKGVEVSQEGDTSGSEDVKRRKIDYVDHVDVKSEIQDF